MSKLYFLKKLNYFSHNLRSKKRAKRKRMERIIYHFGDDKQCFFLNILASIICSRLLLVICPFEACAPTGAGWRSTGRDVERTDKSPLQSESRKRWRAFAPQRIRLKLTSSHFKWNRNLTWRKKNADNSHRKRYQR